MNPMSLMMFVSRMHHTLSFVPLVYILDALNHSFNLFVFDVASWTLDELEISAEKGQPHSFNNVQSFC